MKHIHDLKNELRLIVFVGILESTDRKESLNEWKETEKRDWEITESECSIEGGEVDSINKSNLTEKNNEGD